MEKEKKKLHKKPTHKEIRDKILKWRKLREMVTESWDNKLSALEEIRAQRGK